MSILQCTGTKKIKQERVENYSVKTLGFVINAKPVCDAEFEFVDNINRKPFIRTAWNLKPSIF